MALKAHEIGARVFDANTTIGVYEAQPDRTNICATDGGASGDLLASLLCDLHHWANSNGLDWDVVAIDAADEYREQTGGPAYR